MRRTITLELLQKLARKRGGECLADSFRNVRTYLTWVCAEGHTWQAITQQILQGSWCPTCARLTSKKHSIEEMREIARKRGGRCLSKTYQHSKAHLTFQCTKGHTWQTAAASLLRGHWCPRCAGMARKTLADMQALAAKQGGRCLSRRYVNRLTRLTWRCKQGHTWSTAPQNIMNGTWCPRCAIKPLPTRAELNALAARKGGKCLSAGLKDRRIRLTWRCAKGHTWKATLKSIRKGTWCARCANDAKLLTLGEMRALARSRGGKCLSKTYVYSDAHLLWQCKRGHKWKASPAHVKRGNWCPRCAYLR